MKKACSWYFPTIYMHAEQGPNHSMMLAFNDSHDTYGTLVRESIQNSLDAVDSPIKPVRVEFSFNSIRLKEFDSFLKIKDHIQGSIDYFNHNENMDYYKEMLNYLEKSFYLNKLYFLRISDYNTVGMNYDENDNTSPFYAFVQSTGVSSKSDDSKGGSFGLGKGAYFLHSKIKKLFKNYSENLLSNILQKAS